jgi:hypothetical protein
MYRNAAMPSPANDTGMLRTLIVSVLGLLPAGVVSSMMLLQIFGVWTY